MKTRPTILLLDDEPSALELLGTALEGEQAYAVVTAPNVEAAERLAELHVPSLAIVDVNLKGENGLDFCVWMRQHMFLRDTLIMMLTGQSQTEQKLRGFEAGADEYITKPFNPPELLSKVRALMRIKAMQDELKKDREELARVTRIQEQLAGKERPPDTGAMSDDEKRRLFQAVANAGFTSIQTAREYQEFLPTELGLITADLVGLPLLLSSRLRPKRPCLHLPPLF